MPQGTIKILSGFTAGGTTDTVARLLAKQLHDQAGRVVIVENRPGASGRIAAEGLKRAQPDGRTLLLAPIVVTVLAPLVFNNLEYDPVEDFSPVSHVANYAFAVFVAPEHPARTMAEFVAWARVSGQPVSFGSPGAGSLPHFLGVMIGNATGLTMVHVPYRGGGPLVSDLLGGRLPLGINVLSDVAAMQRAGTLRILATSGATRSRLLPDVSTLREEGYPQLEASGWIALYAPANTPRRIREAYADQVVMALHDPSVRDTVATMGLEATGSDPDGLVAVERRDRARWAPAIKASGFHAD